MKTFKDNAGRTWTVAVNVACIKRVKGLLEIDLTEAVDGELLERLLNDPVLLCDVVYCACKTEADAQNVTDEQFGQAMAGDALDRAAEALLEDLVDFFPSGKRTVLRKALAKIQEVEAKARTLQEKRIDDPALSETLYRAMVRKAEQAEKKLRAELEEFGESSGNSPAPSASTQAPSPSAS